MHHAQMELGGKDVCIVCDDADLDLAAKNIVKGGFSYSGQRCTAVKLVRRGALLREGSRGMCLQDPGCVTAGLKHMSCSVHVARGFPACRDHSSRPVLQPRQAPIARQPCLCRQRSGAQCRSLMQVLGAQVLALESIADELVAKVVKGVEGLSVGKPEVGAA